MNRQETPGKALHDRLYAEWGEFAAFGPDGDISGLGDVARHGWESVSRDFLAGYAERVLELDDPSVDALAACKGLG